MSTTPKHPSSRVGVVVGAGNALGGAIARRFAREGYAMAIARRSADRLTQLAEQIAALGGTALPLAVDARREEQVVSMFERVVAELGPPELVVFNVGGNVKFPILELTAKKYFKTWEMAALSGFLVGREAARIMLPRGSGTILFTGATASLRGGSGFAAFAGGKAALRMLAQSMARELGPRGLHIAHVIVDGGIDTEFMRDHFPERYALKDHDGILNPEHIAETYWHLHGQPRDAWTHEVDLRPWIEKW
ncbi:MAG: SDR family NAD(P)-dependent oxidoreductase [Rhodospirillales bacterium]|nr:SDR family NAD(P)-dependent oxidoreductase [Rhodospirillales bacterium]